MTDSTRRRALAIGGAALATGLAGCLFDDTTGVPGRDSADEGEPLDDEASADGTFGPVE